jgi:hypothetical protein
MYRVVLIYVHDGRMLTFVSDLSLYADISQARLPLQLYLNVYEQFCTPLIA